MSEFVSLERPTRVGYLRKGQGYPQGELSDVVFDRLVLFVQWAILFTLGYHNCDLDPCDPYQWSESLYKGLWIPNRCSTDFLVPDGTMLYKAPSLILHYVHSHHYLPPAGFLEAVLRCPEPSSDEYLSVLEKFHHCPNIVWPWHHWPQGWPKR
jgi:hypothetical protein